MLLCAQRCPDGAIEIPVHHNVSWRLKGNQALSLNDQESRKCHQDAKMICPRLQGQFVVLSRIFAAAVAAEMAIVIVI